MSLERVLGQFSAAPLKQRHAWQFSGMLVLLAILLVVLLAPSPAYPQSPCFDSCRAAFAARTALLNSNAVCNTGNLFQQAACAGQFVNGSIDIQNGCFNSCLLPPPVTLPPSPPIVPPVVAPPVPPVPPGGTTVLGPAPPGGAIVCDDRGSRVPCPTECGGI